MPPPSLARWCRGRAGCRAVEKFVIGGGRPPGRTSHGHHSGRSRGRPRPAPRAPVSSSHGTAATRLSHCQSSPHETLYPTHILVYGAVHGIEFVFEWCLSEPESISFRHRQHAGARLITHRVGAIWPIRASSSGLLTATSVDLFPTRNCYVYRSISSCGSKG